MRKSITLVLILSLILVLVAGCSKGKATSPSAPLNSPVPSIPQTGISRAQQSPSPPTANIATPQAGSAGAPSTSINNSDGTSNILQAGITLQVTQPLDSALIASNSVTVQGRTVPGAIVTVNDQVGAADANGNFAIPLDLDDGINAIDVVASDANGKQGEVLIMVEADLSQAPTSISPLNNSPSTSTDSSNAIPLKVTQPIDGADVNAGLVTVKGQTAPNATVCINDEVDTSDANGNFSINLSLDPGPAAIDVLATDEDGNQSEVILLVNVN